MLNECEVCERTKETKKTKKPLQITSQGPKPFDHVFIDFIGPIKPPSEAGHKYIFMATCDLSKYTVAAATFDCTALTAASCFMNEIILKFGFPSKVTSDNATSFTSNLFKEINKKLKIKQISITPYHPQSNIVERQNRTLNAYVRALTNKKPQQWAELIPYYIFSYNQTQHSTTNFSPHQLVFCYEIRMPDQLLRKAPVYNFDNYVDVMRKELTDAWELAKERLHERKVTNKDNYD